MRKSSFLFLGLFFFQPVSDHSEAEDGNGSIAKQGNDERDDEVGVEHDRQAEDDRFNDGEDCGREGDSGKGLELRELLGVLQHEDKQRPCGAGPHAETREALGPHMRGIGNGATIDEELDILEVPGGQEGAGNSADDVVAMQADLSLNIPIHPSRKAATDGVQKPVPKQFPMPG